MNATHNDNQGSDSDSEYDFVATESDNTSNSEHISEESDLPNSDIEQGDVITASQPETLQKDDIAAINSMTIWLCQNSEWNKGRTNTRRMFLSQLSMALSD
ncbi:unnamed protein product [Rotaria sordida]|uniref:Uncharacterized protein n=2 Tax=Rotaria sordida TaxID=392033 RepID=A0A815K1V1_9BILA|nr:unnamed protein product [Rotaria sordida]CAF1322227.1 unnamed protein product [Rotaria sordida]CAF1387482.1 unnamed protein product [Rotaria sordida]CAF1586452.1 unnamed protein product [Rotaria sordida]CAF3597967.1 unnamed protein product [Rotaria sordida]